MQLSRSSSYAITFLVHLARKNPDRLVPSHEVAREQDLPKRFLLKVLGSLPSAGILRSVRGPNGGYRLARAPKEVALLEVVEAVDRRLRGDASATSKEGAALDKRLQVVCDEVLALVRERLEEVTLAELAIQFQCRCRRACCSSAVASAPSRLTGGVSCGSAGSPFSIGVSRDGQIWLGRPAEWSCPKGVFGFIKVTNVPFPAPFLPFAIARSPLPVTAP
jgi:Rrf2 family protein